jgi:tetratricopeptide (TPR) repeat protein
LASALCVWAWCGTARAEIPASDAREHFERGYAFTQTGDFEQALDEFRLAYAASPNFSVLFNLGQAYGASGRVVQAAHTLERYLEIGGDKIDAEQRRRTLVIIERYRRRIGRIALVGLPGGSIVSLDGEEEGTAPLQLPIEASSGRHAVSIRAFGYQPLVLPVDVKATEVVEITVALVPVPSPATRDARAERSGALCAVLEQAREKRRKTHKTAALALGGGAVLAGGVAITLAIANSARYAAWRKRSEAYASAFQRDPNSVSVNQLEALLTDENSIRNRDTTVVGLGVAASALALTSIGLYLTAGSAAPTLSVTPRGEASVGYQASF